jgi:hypothetical protein
MATEGFEVVAGAIESMTEIEAPKNVLEDVMRSMRRIHRRPFKIFRNRLEKWFSWISIGSIGGVVVFSVLFSAVPWPQPQWPWWGTLAYLSMVMYYLSFMLAIFAGTVSSIRMIFSPERSMFAPVVTAFGEETSLVVRLADTYEHEHLEYAQDRITLLVTQLRSRIALLIGALDKVGVLPLAVGAYFSLRALLKEQPFTPSELPWMVGLAIGLGVLYVAGMALQGWTQWLEEVCLVLKYAVQAKPSDRP